MSGLRDKLYQYEATPPANSWDKIAAALDEAHLDSQFPSTLHNLEAAPPAGAWEKIREMMDEESETEAGREHHYEQSEATVIPIKRRRAMPVWKYAAAAAIVGTLGWLGINFINTSSDITVQLPAAAAAAVPDTGNTPSQNTSVEATTGNGEEQLIAQNRQSSVKPARTAKPTNKTNTSIRATADESGFDYASNQSAIADRYIMLMTPDGNFIRMSKKWSNMICCVSGEEQNADCKDQLKKWQEKLAASPLTTSPGNFMDILSLVSELDKSSEL